MSQPSKRIEYVFPRANGQHGFSLIEIAIVLVIIGLLLGGLLMPLATQVDVERRKQTQATLEEIKDALLGYAAANGRFPCPASAASNGVESPVGGGACTNSYNGFVPGVTLGLTQVDSAGNVVDAWSSPVNRIRYVVTTSNGSAFTTANGMKTTTIATLAPNLDVCGRATGVTPTSCNTAPTLANNAVVVVFSLAKNAAQGGASADELANLNNDQVFVSRVASPAGSALGEFDDIVTWMAPAIIYNRLIAAQVLP